MNLRITLIAGLILLVLSGGVLTFFYLNERKTSGSARQQDSFYRTLREYDEKISLFYGTQREIDSLHDDLDRMEKKAISVESWLSIIKRRRALTNNQLSSAEKYLGTIENARKAYPSSAPIAAAAAAAIVKGSPLNRQKEEEVRQLLQLFQDPAYNKLRLSLHVVLGDFNSPQNAVVIPADIYSYPSGGMEPLAVNLAIIKTLRGDRIGASADIQSLLSGSPAPEAVRFAAEYHYDFGDLMRSAQLFALIKDTKSLIRQADALYLAGFPYNAVSIWLLLSESDNEAGFYNLAATAESVSESAMYLEKLVNREGAPEEKNSIAREFALIKHSRFLDYAGACALLINNKYFPPAWYPYIDLEICKRHVQNQNLGYQTAQTWLMLDRHDKNEELHRWAAWHFFFQKCLDEERILLDRLELFKFTESWTDIYRALFFMYEGYLDAAEKIFRSVPVQESSWDINANLGRILETIRYPAHALEQYETASAKLLASAPENRKTASRIQTRIAKCLTAMNRHSDARAALLTALDLDPENLAAQMDLIRE